MNYFENALRLRLSSQDTYSIHQQIDTLVQESIGSKLQYAYYTLSDPQSPDTHCAVFVRSQFSIGFAGERKLGLEIKDGTTISFLAQVCAKRNRKLLSPTGRRVVYTATPEDFKSLILPSRIEMIGLGLSNAVILDKVHKIMKKGKAEFASGGYEVAVEAKVVDKHLFEKAFIEGFGKNRVWGFGLIRNLEVVE